MTWPIYVASAVAALSQLLPTTGSSNKKSTSSTGSTTTTTTATGVEVVDRTFFYSGILTVSIGYLVLSELRRRRIWDYWRLQWRRRFCKKSSAPKGADDKEESWNVTDLGGVKVKRLVSPQDNRTSYLHVDMLTILPKKQLTGCSEGVEWYHVIKGSIRINDVVVKTTHVVEPFLNRTIVNPSSTQSALVYRATDGICNDTTRDIPQGSTSKTYISSAWESISGAKSK